MAKGKRGPDKVYATNALRQRAYRMRCVSADGARVLRRLMCDTNFFLVHSSTAAALKARGLIVEKVYVEPFKTRYALTRAGYEFGSRLLRIERGEESVPGTGVRPEGVSPGHFYSAGIRGFVNGRRARSANH